MGRWLKREVGGGRRSWRRLGEMVEEKGGRRKSELERRARKIVEERVGGGRGRVAEMVAEKGGRGWKVGEEGWRDG